MMDFMFFLKTFLLTMVVVLLLQIPIGEQSIEDHAVGWAQNSALISPFETVAKGGSKLIQDLTRQISTAIHHNVSKGKKDEAPKKSSSFRWSHSSKQVDSEPED